jgi:hypothetical protein
MKYTPVVVIIVGTAEAFERLERLLTLTIFVKIFPAVVLVPLFITENENILDFA